MDFYDAVKAYGLTCTNDLTTKFSSDVTVRSGGIFVGKFYKIFYEFKNTPGGLYLNRSLYLRDASILGRYAGVFDAIPYEFVKASLKSVLCFFVDNNYLVPLEFFKALMKAVALDLSAKTGVGTGGLVSISQLKDMFEQTSHFMANSVTGIVVGDLNRVLTKYKIETPLKIAMFIATIAHESKTGLIEKGIGDTYVKDGVDYCGGGYAQLTGYNNYKAFAEQMLKDGLVSLNKDGTNPIMSIGGGAEYIAKNFAWEAAGWHWTAPGNNCNNRIDKGEDFYKISQVINGGPSYTGTPNGWDERKKFFELALQIFK